MDLGEYGSADAYIRNTTLNRSGDGGSFRVDGWYLTFESSWQLVDAKGLSNIWHYNITGSEGGRDNWTLTVTSTHDHYGYYYPPLVMDLNGDGIHFTSIQNSNVSIDVNSEGVKYKMAWAGNDDGVLVWDKDHNKQISEASEFGFQRLKADAQTDLEGLQALDTNHNGLLDAGDEKFAEFAVWQDANGNGVTDEGEFLTLQERGIASIQLHSDGQVRDAGTPLPGSTTGETDATVMGNAIFTRTDGSTGTVADAMLAYEPGQASAPSKDTETEAASAAELARQAALFNQLCNTDLAVQAEPLGFVPIEQQLPIIDVQVLGQDISYHQPQAA